MKRIFLVCLSASVLLGSALGIRAYDSSGGWDVGVTGESATYTGNKTVTGTLVATGVRDAAVGFTSIAAASLDMDATPFSYVNVGAGTTSTVLMPATPLAGAVHFVMHNNGTTATTLTAQGGFSINGNVSDASLDAAGDFAVVIGTGTGWNAVFSLH